MEQRTSGASIPVAVDSLGFIPSGEYLLERPEIFANFEGWNVRICGTGGSPARHRCWMVWIGDPGQLSLVRDSE
jgi:hypothetical protein